MNRKILRIVVIAFFAALIAATGFFRMPVPGLQGGIIIQNGMVMLTAVLLGGILGAAPACLFFAVGLIGVPVFAGWTGGISAIANVNGGFKVGYLVGAFVTGLIAGKSSTEDKNITVKYVIRITIAVFAGLLALYIPEVFWVLAYRSNSAYFNEYTIQQLGLSSELIGQVAKYTPEIIEKFNLSPSLSKQIIIFTPELIEQMGLDAEKIGLLKTKGALKMFITIFFTPYLIVDSIKGVFAVLLALKLRPVTAQYVYNQE